MPCRVRRLGLLAVLSLVLAAAAAGCWDGGGRGGSGKGCPADPLRARVLAQLSSYVGWLSRHHARGYVGEVGWPAGPDSGRWDALADSWYDAADDAGLPVTAWAAGERWPAGYPLAIYRPDRPGEPLNSAAPQARVVERHPGSAAAPRGVSVAGAEFGTEVPGYSARQPGTYGQDYGYPSAAGFRYLAARGISLVRIPFAWERVQPTLHGPLAGAELSSLRHAVRSAHAAGLRVALDLHNFGRYRAGRSDAAGGVRELVLGSKELPATDLADVWRRLALVFRAEPGVWGYGLMNEPHDLPGSRGGAATWEDASQRTVDAIREVDPHTQVLVAGADWSKVEDWTRTHSRPWVHDPARAIRYEAHQYFDADGSGRYAASYRAASAAVRAAGRSPDC